MSMIDRTALVRSVLVMTLAFPVGLVQGGEHMTTLSLPTPRSESELSVEGALLKRRSVRDYTSESLTLADLGQLLWAAQGVTSRRGFRTAPSAGALYPLEVYAVVGAVEGLSPGIYRYRPAKHALRSWRDGDRRAQLAQAALQQESVRDAPVVLVFAADESRTARKYGRRARRYVLIEVGHAAQNVFLQVQALNLGAVVVGAFDDKEVEAVLELPASEDALYLLPVGQPESSADP